jgi:hypothetical protein
VTSRTRSGLAAAPARIRLQRSSNLGCQPTLEQASAQAADWFVARSPLSQALIQYRQRLANEPRLGILVILLRQHMNSTILLAVAQSTTHAMLDLAGNPQLPSVRLYATSLNTKLLRAKNERVPRPSGVRAGPKVRPTDTSSGTVFTIETGALFAIGITAFLARPCAAPLRRW